MKRLGRLYRISDIKAIPVRGRLGRLYPLRLVVKGGD